MKASRTLGAISLPVTIGLILTVAAVLTMLFYLFWQKLNLKVDAILIDQFNQQQLTLARKIGDNVESHFDLLESGLLGYAGLFQSTLPQERELNDVMAERFGRHRRFGILDIRRFNAAVVPNSKVSGCPAACSHWGRISSITVLTPLDTMTRTGAPCPAAGHAVHKIIPTAAAATAAPTKRFFIAPSPII